MEKTEKYKKYSCHKCRYGKTFKTVLLDYTIYYYYKGTSGTAYLNFAAAKHWDDKSCYYGGDYSLLRSNTRGYSKCNGQWKGYDTNDYSGHKVGHKTFAIVVPQCVEELGSEF